MKNYVIVLMCLFLSVSVIAQDTEKKSRKERKAERKAQQIAEVKELIDNQTYEFVPDQAIPSRGRTVNVNSFFLRVEGDDINCYLPFYGRSQVPGYGGGDSPYNFEKKAEGYEISKVKNKYVIKFSVKNDSDKVDFQLEVFETGSSTLQVISPQRDQMMYNGNLQKVEKPKEKK